MRVTLEIRSYPGSTRSPKLELPARKMKKQETKKRDEKKIQNSHQSPFLFFQKCLKICEMSKENLNTDQSANCRLRVPENFCITRAMRRSSMGQQFPHHSPTPRIPFPLRPHKPISSPEQTNKPKPCLPSDALSPATISRLIGPTVPSTPTFTVYKPRFWTIYKTSQPSR